MPEVMLAISHHGGRIRPRVALFKAIAAAITIGSGGSAGREGPIVQIGAAFGSSLAQWLRLPDRRIMLAVACGAAGGISATFNAPMAGVIFAMEVILSRFTANTFILVELSSATASVITRTVEGDVPAFHVDSHYLMQSPWEILFFALLGVLCALVSQMYTRTVCAVEDVTEKVRLPEYIKPAIGGALTGVLAVFVPQIMSGGYEHIEMALNNELAMDVLFLLCAAKLAATALTVGTGGSGGVFAPALFVGAMFGGGFGGLVHRLAPGLNSGSYALVAMAAVFGGASHAPITAIFIVFELTDDYRIIIPLMTATVMSTMISQWISPYSIYTIKLKRRGYHVGVVPEVSLMDAVTVEEAMAREYPDVSPDMPLTEMLVKFANDHETGYPVVDNDGRLFGVVTMQDVESALMDRNPDALTVADICTRNVVVCRPEQSLTHALNQFATHNIGRLPVIDPNATDTLIGILKRADVVSAYARAHQRSARMIRRMDDLQTLQEQSEMVLSHAQVNHGTALARSAVRDVMFPPGCILGAIRRGRVTIVPRGSTEVLLGDELVLLSTRENAAIVRKWLRELA
ncbi:MAG: chloride channel protein [Candidatus Hydrogenedentota bacterium]